MTTRMAYNKIFYFSAKTFPRSKLKTLNISVLDKEEK